MPERSACPPCSPRACATARATDTNFATTPTTVAQANNIDAHNGNGQITATIVETDPSTLATLTGSHAYTITVTDSTAVALNLLKVDQATTVQVTATTDGIEITGLTTNYVQITGITFTNPVDHTA